MKYLQICFTLTAIVLAIRNVSGQSLKPDDPYPLKAGINQGTSDSLVGTHYWYFYSMPGSTRVTVRFVKATALFGAPIANTSLTVTLSDEKRTWRNTKVVTPARNQSEATFTAEKIDKKLKVIIAIAPPNQNLLRAGGDYEIEATGAVQFDEVRSAADPVVRTYSPKTGLDDYGAVKFLADGTIETANGFRGTWKLFDRENRIYSVVIDKFRVSVQYLPGRGLVRPDDPSLIVFQELRR